tara:strand:- start:101 stop:952 length:852 start_codon:yes stop_codon:yes gene_type:complete
MLTPKIYLVAHVGVQSGANLIRHFLDHYYRLGVQNFLVILHSDKNEHILRDSVLSILRHRNIVPVMEVNTYDYRLRQERVNFVLDQYVTDDDWVVHADTDEFHEYPDGLLNLVKRCETSGHTFVRGTLVDMVSASGELKEITRWPSIWEQFPKSSDLTGKIGRGWTKKICCAKGGHRAGDGGTHSVDFGLGRLGNFEACLSHPMCHPDELRVFHFKWDSTVLTRLRSREKVYKTLGLEVANESSRILKYLENSCIEYKDIVPPKLIFENPVYPGHEDSNRAEN